MAGTLPSQSERERRENKVKEFWTNNLLRYYVDQEVFDQCYGRIKHWLDVNTLVGYMMKHGLISSPAEMEKITSPYFLPEQRQNSLLSLANSRGEYGFFLLYMCIKESVDENPHGHGDAVRVLEAEATRMGKQPPWHTSSYGHQETATSPPAVQPSQVVYSRGSHDPMVAPPTGPYRPTPNPPPSAGGGGRGGGSHDPMVASPTGPYRPTPNPPPSAGGGGRGGGSHDPMVAPPTGPYRPTPNPPPSAGGGGRGGGGREDKGTPRPTVGAAVQQQRSNGGPQGLDSEKFIKQQKAKHAAQQKSLITSSPPTIAPPPGQMVSSRPAPSTVLTRPPTFPGPRPQLAPQPQSGGASSFDDIIERDRARARRQAAQFVYDQVKGDVARGAVASLFEKFEGEVDLDIVSEADCRDKSDFMDEVSKFVVGSFNSRGSGKMSILLAGVSVDGTEAVITGLPSCFDVPKLAAVRNRFHDIIKSKVKSRTGTSVEEQLTSAELALVKFDVVSIPTSSGPPRAQPTTDVKQVVIVAVSPDWGVCRNKLYQCRFVDASGRPKPLEVFKRSEGGTVSVRMHKLKQLESELNSAFARLSTH